MSVNWNKVLSPPDVGKEIVKTLSVETLADIWSNCRPDEECCLDNEEIIKAIVGRKDKAAQVLCAKYGNLHLYSGFTAQELVELAGRSRSHTLAILGNTRIDWYSFWMGRENLLVEELIFPTVEADDFATHILLKNPRMDRKLIGDIIRGEGQFQEIPASTRIKFGFFAIGADYVEDSDTVYYEGIMPSENDINFRKPTEALFAILSQHEKEYRVHFEDLVNLQKPRVFSICDDDWIDEEGRSEIGDLTDYHEKLRMRDARALNNFINWLLDWSKEEPLDTGEEKDRFGVYVKGSFAVVALKEALSRFSDKNESEQTIQRIAQSKHWVR